MAIIKLLLITFVFFFSLPPFLSSNPDRIRAEKSFRLGQYDEASFFYKRYLDTAQNIPNFADILLRASVSEGEIVKGLNLLLAYDHKTTNPVQRSIIFRRIGLIQEYLGNDEAASAAYRIVFENSHSNPDYDIYLRSGFLALEAGNTDYSLDVANQILREVSDGNIKITAVMLAISALFFDNDVEHAIALLSQEVDTIKKFARPSHHYTLWRFYKRYPSLETQALNTKTFILTYYPKSPEAMLIKGQAKSWISPLNLFL